MEVDEAFFGFALEVANVLAGGVSGGDFGLFGKDRVCKAAALLSGRVRGAVNVFGMGRA